MAPTKIGKKKRAGGGAPPTSASGRHGISPITESSHVASASNGGGVVVSGGSSGTSATPHTLQTAAEFYGRIVHESRSVVFRLDGSVWLHQIVSIGVLNALMYAADLQWHQICVIFLSALWLGRRFILNQVIARADLWKQMVAWRVVLLVLFIAASCMLNYYAFGDISMQPAVVIGIAGALDMASIVGGLLRPSLRRSINVWVAVVHISEMLFIAGAFSTQYNHQPFLIYDRLAFALVLGMTVVHYLVVDGVKHALFALPWASEDQVTREQQRRWQVVDEIRETLDHRDVPCPFVGKSNSGNGLSGTSSSTPASSASNTAGSSSGSSSPVCTVQHMRLASRGQVALWTSLQTMAVLVQVVAVSFVLHSWELGSVFMCASVHLLVELLHIHRTLHSQPLEGAC